MVRVIRIKRLFFYQTMLLVICCDVVVVVTSRFDVARVVVVFLPCLTTFFVGILDIVAFGKFT